MYDPYNNGTGFDDDFIDQLEQLQVPKGIRRATATLGQLVRFADSRQTRFKGPPNKDGSNTHQGLTWDAGNERPLETNGSPGLRYMWICYSNILRAIHREGQMRGGAGDNWIYEPWNELEEMMDTYPERLERIENERLDDDSINNKITPGFEWLYSYNEHLVEMMASFQAILTWAKEANIDPKGHTPKVSRPPLIVRLLT